MPAVTKVTENQETSLSPLDVPPHKTTKVSRDSTSGPRKTSSLMANKETNVDFLPQKAATLAKLKDLNEIALKLVDAIRKAHYTSKKLEEVHEKFSAKKAAYKQQKICGEQQMKAHEIYKDQRAIYFKDIDKIKTSIYEIKAIALEADQKLSELRIELFHLKKLLESTKSEILDLQNMLNQENISQTDKINLEEKLNKAYKNIEETKEIISMIHKETEDGEAKTLYSILNEILSELTGKMNSSQARYY